ncbi:DUF4439 domain-containing protein [Arthrobacter sp. UYEF21]|uniref:DUF4439 domain-containing protein n=1 Tax=Arthrobacter sp. UYEF21 TaxID=1756364 RepID=UPI003397A7F5
MKDDTQEAGHRGRYFRYAVFTLAALLVVSLGFVLIPREPAAPAPPPFSEQARAAAFSDAVDLRAAGSDLEGRAGGMLPAADSVEVSAAVSRAVTLLTVHARALMLPAYPSLSTPALAPSSAPAPRPSTPADLAAALHSSGVQRLNDAETTDGGMARLLAGAGIAQLLAAGELAAAAGVEVDAPVSTPLPSGAPTPPTGCTATATAGSAGTGSSGSGSTGADLASSFSAVLEAEQELVYAYQAALNRLNPATVAPASGFLAEHEDLRREAAAMGVAHCAAMRPTPAGYALDEAFLADPARALGSLEAGTLPAYGDLIALSDGADRAWALSALQSAVRRTTHWGGSPGPVPGAVLDESRLPLLPESAQAPGPAATSAAQS